MTSHTFLCRVTRALCLTALVGGVFPGPAHAAAPQVRTQAPGFYRMMLGDVEITALCDGTVPQEMEKLLTRIPPERVTALLAAAYLASPVELSINAYLINTGSKLLLVDTGAGEQFGPVAGHLVTSLRAAGYQPEQIDAVLLTHIHGDHSGGLMVAGKQVFPNALVYADKREVDYWLSPANAQKAPESARPQFQTAVAMLTPYVTAGRLKTFQGNTELFPGVRTLEGAGHTPGHTFYAVESQGQKLVFWGDMMHVAAVQFPEPSVTIKYDVDSTAAAARRAKAYADAAKQGYAVAIDHVSFPGLGRLRAQGKGYGWVPVNYSYSLETASAPTPPGAPTKGEPESIGMAEMSQDGTLTLTLRATGPGVVGDGRLVYPPTHAQYEYIKKHVGPIKPGEQKPVAPFPSP